MIHQRELRNFIYHVLEANRSKNEAYYMKEKDFYLYSKARKGLLPRALILNNGEWIVNNLLKKSNKRMITIVEMGFNHGNDSRYICELMYRHLGSYGWRFLGYDYKKYFMPENIYMDENVFPGINNCITAIPCTLVEISEETSKLPQHIDFLYSSKTLTLCEIDVFKRIMENICNKITDGGFFVCSLHTKTNSDDIFPTYDELYHMISDEMLFADFSLYVQSKNEDCNFAFIAQKSGKHSVSVNDEKFINTSQHDYAKVAKEEADTIFVE